MKINMSLLTPKSQKILAKKMSMDDLEKLVILRGDVIGKKVSIEDYRKEEKKMIKKYGFNIK